MTNRVEASFDALPHRLARHGRHAKRKDTETVLVTDGTNTFALCHVQDTPLTLWDPGTDWEGLTGTLSRERGAGCPSSRCPSTCRTRAWC